MRNCWVSLFALKACLVLIFSGSSALAQHQHHHDPEDLQKPPRLSPAPQQGNGDGHHGGHHPMPPKKAPAQTPQERLYRLVIDYVDRSVWPSLQQYTKDNRQIGLFLADRGRLAPRYPGPTLVFQEGQTAVIEVDNRLEEETSIHWHGLIVPQDQDGVPHLTMDPIKPHSKRTFRFPLRQSGTYWYHSHAGHQEQRGLYGAFIIKPKVKPSHYSYDRQSVLLFSDYTQRDPTEIVNNLKNDPEKEPRLKGTETTVHQDIKNANLAKAIKSAWDRMGAMDIADVALDAVFVNGSETFHIKTGSDKKEKVLLRLINASASSIFRVKFGQGRPMTIVANDGLDVRPTVVTELVIGTAETYDIVVEVPRDLRVELKTSIFDTKTYLSSSVWIGAETAKRSESSPTPKDLNPYDHTTLGGPYNRLQNVPGVEEKWIWKPGAPLNEFDLKVTGDMRRYVWSFNHKTFGRSKPLEIAKGQRVRLNIVNETMMFHPLHLHGHFFKVVSIETGDHGSGHGGGHGDNGADHGNHDGHGNHGGHATMTATAGGSGGHEHHQPPPIPRPGSGPLWKQTYLMPPMSKVVLEFSADEDRSWLFHCHNLYHMTGGMSLLLNYVQSAPSNGKDLSSSYIKPPIMDHDEMNGTGGGYYNIDASVNNWHGEGTARVTIDESNELAIKGKYSPSESEYRGRLQIYHYIDDKGTAIYAAGENSSHEGTFAAAGVRFLAPMLIDVELGYGTAGPDVCVARDVPLIGALYFRGDYCYQGRQHYYNTGLGYHLTDEKGPVAADIEGGMTEDGPSIGIRVRANGRVKKPGLLDELIKEMDRKK